jgi:hypothetical protein
MPVEIRELIISATVSESSATAASQNNSGGPSADERKIKKALEELQRMLKQKKER